MWGRARVERRWAEAASERSMSVVDDPRPYLGVDLSLLAEETSARFDASESLGFGSPVLDETTSRSAEITRAAVRTSMAGPGLLAVVMLDAEVKSRGWLSRRSTDLPPIQVAIGRLPRPVAVPIGAVPHYSPGDIATTRIATAAAERGIAPPALGHELLEHHWLSLTAEAHTSELAEDEALCALLWTLRSKVSNERVGSPDLAAELEMLISPAERLTDFEAVEVRADIVAVAVQFPWPKTGFHEKLLTLVDHAATEFPAG